jgi:hypothetical protein
VLRRTRVKTACYTVGNGGAGAYHILLLLTDQPSTQKYYSPSTLEMASQSGSARFQALLESALQAYQKKTGIKLAEHPLALKLQHCDSVDDITTLLQGRAEAFNDFRGSDRIMKSIKATVSILTPLSDILSLAGAVGLVSQKALIACFTYPTFFSDIIPTCQSNTCWSRYPN